MTRRNYLALLAASAARLRGQGVSTRSVTAMPRGQPSGLPFNAHFVDVAEKAGLHRTGWVSGVCVGDYNIDGFDDLVVTYWGQNVLYRNDGDGTFTDITEKAGLLRPGVRWGSGCAFVDYNRDGNLDLFVANYLDFDLQKA